MNEAILNEYHIYYVKDPEKSPILPGHVCYLSGVLLDFKMTITDRFSFDEGFDWDLSESTWEEHFRKKQSQDTEKYAVKKAMKKYWDAQYGAEWCLHRDEMENQWQRHYLDFFLGALAEEVEVSNEDSRRVARAKFYYDSFEWSASRPWTLFAKKGKHRNCTPKLTEPKTDFAAYFPIYDFDDSQPTLRKQSSRWRWGDFLKDGMVHNLSLVQNFSLKTLNHLAWYGLESSPISLFKVPATPQSKKPGKARHMCYPWLIVEHKKANMAMEEGCYCQAANAAHATLTMHRILATYTKPLAQDMHIPPVTTMTTVGQEVRIWIAYLSDNGKNCHMVCIWKGDVTKITDIIKLEAILENLHTWAMRELRPWISTYIGQWLANHPMTPSVPPGTTQQQPQWDSGLQNQIISYDASHKGSSDDDGPEYISKAYLREMLAAEHARLFEKIEALMNQDKPTQSPSPVSSSVHAGPSERESEPFLESSGLVLDSAPHTLPVRQSPASPDSPTPGDSYFPPMQESSGENTVRSPSRNESPIDRLSALLDATTIGEPRGQSNESAPDLAKEEETSDIWMGEGSKKLFEGKTTHGKGSNDGIENGHPTQRGVETSNPPSTSNPPEPFTPTVKPKSTQDGKKVAKFGWSTNETMPELLSSKSAPTLFNRPRSPPFRFPTSGQEQETPTHGLIKTSPLNRLASEPGAGPVKSAPAGPSSSEGKELAEDPKGGSAQKIPTTAPFRFTLPEKHRLKWPAE